MNWEINNGVVMARQRVGEVCVRKGDVIENLDEAQRTAELACMGGLVYLFNHFSYSDGYEAPGNLFRLDEVRNKRFYMPVTMYLLGLARGLNLVAGTKVETEGIVTPSLASKKGLQGLIYSHRLGVGKRQHMVKTAEVLEGIEVKGGRVYGVEAIFPQARRGKGGMGEMTEEERVVIEGLLRKTGKFNPSFVPVGMWVTKENEVVDPSKLRGLNFLQYHLKFGIPMDAQRLLYESNKNYRGKGKYEGVGEMMHNAMRELVPSAYR